MACVDVALAKATPATAISLSIFPAMRVLE
jgi:hypothetical protein